MHRDEKLWRNDYSPIEGGIQTSYSDDYLSLIQLLVEAASLEHSLMTSYLFGLFSLKPEYNKIAGNLDDLSFLHNSPQTPEGRESLNNPQSIISIAIEEMQHLSIINKLLVAIGASPHVIPHIFPLSSDVYPFRIDLRPLDRFSVAKYLWLEASTGSLSMHPDASMERESEKLILDVRTTLWNGSFRVGVSPIDIELASHIGSIYKVILRQFRKVAESPPPIIHNDFPWGEWEQKIRWVMGQGEINHYRFFRDLFNGKITTDTDIWKNGISREGFIWRTAYIGRNDSIENEDARQLSWLSNLHYWIILSIMDIAYRENSLRLRYTGIDHMTTSLWRLGTHLAEHYNVGLPFDSMATRYSHGKNDHFSREILKHLVREAEKIAHILDTKKLLPQNYSRTQFGLTLMSLSSLPSPIAT
jgi:hypothetical protein